MFIVENHLKPSFFLRSPGYPFPLMNSPIWSQRIPKCPILMICFTELEKVSAGYSPIFGDIYQPLKSQKLIRITKKPKDW